VTAARDRSLRTRLSRLACLGILFTCATPLAIAAHDRGTSYSVWSIRGDDVHVSARMTDLDLSRYPWGGPHGEARDSQLKEYLPAKLRLYRGGSACSLTEGPRALRSAPGNVTYEWALLCGNSGDYRIESDLLLDVSPAHLHFARAKIDSEMPMERVLSSRGSSWRFDSGGADSGDSSTDLLGYLWLGIEHIITGYDHLAFVLVLLLTGGSLLQVAKIVTGFTIAHSITLGLMVLGYVQPEIAPIEALIGLSIALVAAENLWQASARSAGVPLLCTLALLAMSVAAWFGWGNIPALTLAGLALFSFCYFRLFAVVDHAESLRWGIAFMFGLIHGFGFAAMLTEAGLPADRVVPALLGFNLGVEVGQLAVVAVLWPLLQLLRRHGGRLHAPVVEGTSAAVLALGVFWLVTRAYG